MLSVENFYLHNFQLSEKHNQPDRLLQPCFSTTSTVYSHHWRWRMHILAHSASVMDMMSGHGDSGWKAKIDWQKLQVFF